MSFRSRFSRKKKAVRSLGDTGDLAGELDAKRGNNINVVDSPGNFPPNRDAIKNLSAAARDARYVDRTSEDNLITDLKDYRAT
ncbi:MAG: hypothetical protein ACI9C1_001516 [Candidatus Aldehydirespiratoraceae bacterium]|jgi:hypothetical protein